MSEHKPYEHGPDLDRIPGLEGNGAVSPVEVQAWEQIEAGRYMPRRIKGSCLGRELG